MYPRQITSLYLNVSGTWYRDPWWTKDKHVCLLNVFVIQLFSGRGCATCNQSMWEIYNSNAWRRNGVQRFFLQIVQIPISKFFKKQKSYVPKSSTQKGVVKYDIHNTSVDKSTTQVCPNQTPLDVILISDYKPYWQIYRIPKW